MASSRLSRSWGRQVVGVAAQCCGGARADGFEDGVAGTFEEGEPADAFGGGANAVCERGDKTGTLREGKRDSNGPGCLKDIDSEAVGACQVADLELGGGGNR